MKLKVKIITPSGVFVDNKEVDAVTLQTSDGEITVLAMHMPVVSTLRIGTVTLIDEGRKTYIHVHRGLVRIGGMELKIITERLYLIDEHGNKIDTPSQLE